MTAFLRPLVTCSTHLLLTLLLTLIVLTQSHRLSVCLAVVIIFLVCTLVSDILVQLESSDLPCDSIVAVPVGLL